MRGRGGDLVNAKTQAAPRSAVASDQRFVTSLTRASHSNFYYSFLFLPRPKREAIHALYAFCREVDDSVDQAGSDSEARARVRFWREELRACYAGDAGHPVTRSLARHLEAFPIRREDLEQVIAGVEMDLAPGRFETFDDLVVYCDRVASAVGLACIEIFGYSDPRSRDYAVALGRAFQLTNILRDVAADARKGRVYIPRSDLARFGCDSGELTASAPSPAFLDLMRFETGRGRGLFAEARGLLPPVDRRSLFAAMIMGRIYETILLKIDRDPGAVLARKVALSRPRKMLLALGIYLKARASPRA